MTKEAFRVAHGLDPRSSYPYCDFCAKKDVEANTRMHGTVQLGRWWAHDICAADPYNRRLSSVQLPIVDYRSVRSTRSAWRKVMAMKRLIDRWANGKRTLLRELAQIRGTSLMRETTSEYLW